MARLQREVEKRMYRTPPEAFIIPDINRAPPQDIYIASRIDLANHHQEPMRASTYLTRASPKL